MKQNVIFFGSGDYVIPIVEKLKNYNLQLVITTEKTGPLTQFLQKENIPFLQSNFKNEADIQQIASLHPTIAILASYGAIIPKRVIDLFPLGILNIHPSLLPKYKGPSPIQTTILKGDTQTGVSIIKLDEQVDHGPILAQEVVQLRGDETSKSLIHSLFAKGAEMIESLLGKIEAGETLTATSQDHSKEVFTVKMSREDGFIDFHNPPSSEQLDRMIRAYYPWPGVFFTAKIGGKEKRIKLLPDKKIQIEGKREMNFKDFMNGYQPEGQQILEQLQLL